MELLAPLLFFILPSSVVLVGILGIFLSKTTKGEKIFAVICTLGAVIFLLFWFTVIDVLSGAGSAWNGEADQNKLKPVFAIFGLPVGALLSFTAIGIKRVYQSGRSNTE